jgi:hypothetical protein
MTNQSSTQPEGHQRVQKYQVALVVIIVLSIVAVAFAFFRNSASDRTALAEPQGFVVNTEHAAGDNENVDNEVDVILHAPEENIVKEFRTDFAGYVLDYPIDWSAAIDNRDGRLVVLFDTEPLVFNSIHFDEALVAIDADIKTREYHAGQLGDGFERLLSSLLAEPNRHNARTSAFVSDGGIPVTKIEFETRRFGTSSDENLFYPAVQYLFKYYGYDRYGVQSTIESIGSMRVPYVHYGDVWVEYSAEIESMMHSLRQR